MHSGNTIWRQALMDYILREAQPVDKYGHQPRLYALTREVGKDQSYDDDIVFAAVWLHDLGVFEGHRPSDPAQLAAWDNVAYAMKRAPAILISCGFPEIKISPVTEAIATHQPHKIPKSMEATILRDADILEQLGAVGILRATAKVGRDTRYARFSDVIPALARVLETLPALLRLPSSQALAAPRIAMLSEFLDAVDREAADKLY